MANVISPQLGLDSFSCPHCHALSHQSWYKLYGRSFDGKSKPQIVRYEDFEPVDSSKISDKDHRESFEDFRDRLENNLVTYTVENYPYSSRMEMQNLHLSHCYSCKGFAVWLLDEIIYPTHHAEITAHEDMPATLKFDFEEAASIINLSPRGAAALLRLCIQKLMPILGEKGKNINDDIASLVSKGLDQRIQKALDAMRVIGNHAVHPGVLDLTDDKATALTLFELLNSIIAATISANKKIEAMYGKIPPNLKTEIEKRDAAKATDPKS
jgi:Domain of unknown function (DUF4145)